MGAQSNDECYLNGTIRKNIFFCKKQQSIRQKSALYYFPHDTIYVLATKTSSPYTNYIMSKLVTLLLTVSISHRQMKTLKYIITY